MSHFVESQSSGSSSLRVSNKDNGQDMVKAFLQEVSDVELLVAYGSAFDEGALVRDVSSTGLDIIKALKSKGVINLYPACARIKQAHDLQFNPATRSHVQPQVLHKTRNRMTWMLCIHSLSSQLAGGLPDRCLRVCYCPHWEQEGSGHLFARLHCVIYCMSNLHYSS